MAIQPVTGACVCISLVNVRFIVTLLINLIGGNLSKKIFTVV